jgi:uncharacterized FAD-dependent dehydrogenase
MKILVLFWRGGAGTYSDGKLYTRSKKRGCNTEVLGVVSLILGYFSGSLHPHIGTNKLPQIIQDIRRENYQVGFCER